MIVRRAARGDELILRAVRLQAVSDTPEAFGSTYDRELARTIADWQRWMSPGATFILDDAGRARGIIAGMRDESDAAVVHLMSMWVDPSLRGSGAAEALVASLLTWAETEGARQMRLAVIQTNDRARRFYERLGFRENGRQSVRQRDGAIEVEMERALADEPRDT
jgi:ribosomal protein S18 acetylase RimI-like enzyme